MFKQAKPIWAKEYVNEKNIMLEFTADMVFSGKFSKIRIAADALYRLIINGKIVAHGPQRAGKGFWRVDEIDLTHKLSRGEKNEIKIQVLSYGLVSFEYVLQQAFLMAELEMDDNVILKTGADGDFTAKRILSKKQETERYSFQRPCIEVWELPVKYSEELELINLEDKKVMARTAPMPQLDIKPFDKLIAKGEMKIPAVNVERRATRRVSTVENFCFDDIEGGLTYRDHVHQMETIKINHMEENTEDATFELNENEFINLKLPYENTGFLHFDVQCANDAIVYFIWDEILCNDDVIPTEHYAGTTNVIPFYIEAGEHQFTCIDPKSFHYLKVLDVKGNVKLKNISLMEYVNPNSKTAQFECDDEALNRIYNAAVHTFEQNASDIFMDCPSRERAGWLCDSFFTGRTEKDITGESCIEKGFLENFFYATDFGKLPKGMFPMCYPSDILNTDDDIDKRAFIPNWAMFLVVELEEYVKRTGDTGIIELARQRFYELEDYFKQFINGDGLLEKLNGWVFLEHSQANVWVQDVNFPSNMMYYAMLKAMARMYNDHDLDVKAEGIKETIKKLSFNGKFFRDHQIYDGTGKKVIPEDITEVCQYYAFFSGVATKEEYPELLEIIAKDFGAGHKCEKTHPGVYPANAFIGNYLRMEVLSFNGYRKQVINEIKDYFDYMAIRTGTLWESDTTRSSCNHGFASHVIRFIFRDCLGINEIDENNKKIYLNNDYTAPQNAKALIPLKSGSIKVIIEGGARKVEIVGDYKIG
ncbi:MAG: hypothetical protein E7365_01420 [Clostridiales bacterium]|nr:hypothetical protein [Clostridiales bacterium]